MLSLKTQLNRLKRCVANKTPGNTKGSKSRNLFSAGMGLLGLLLLSEILFAWFGFVGLKLTPFTTGILALLGFVFFFVTTITVIRLRSNLFVVAPLRLLRDVAISIFYAIVAFAVYYHATGIIPTFNTESDVTSLDALYFSTVTFSTLGYGDFRPSPDARIMASAQALLGTVHIGMIVGAAFLTITPNSSDRHPDKSKRNTDSDY